MGGTKLLVALSLCLMVASTMGQGSQRRLSYSAQQCRIDRLSSSEPNQRIECEGGLIELWDETEEQYQCSGIQSMRVTIKPNSLSLPNYHPSPRLVYIERGEGILGVTFPGCPETYDDSERRGQDEESQRGQRRGDEESQRGQRSWDEEESRRGREEEGQRGRRRGDEEESRRGREDESQRGRRRGDEEEGQSRRHGRRHGGEEEREGGFEGDLHQKVHRFKRGDVLAIPPGAVHWCYNDGNDEDVVAVIVNDLNNPSNQLDQRFRPFYLAGGAGRSGERSIRRMGERHQHNFHNIFSHLSTELMAEALVVPKELMRKVQQSGDRSLIVRVKKGEMRIVGPRREDDEEEGQEFERRRKYMGLDDVVDVEASTNGLEESICTMKLRHSLNHRREADVYSRHGGRLNIVNEQKLPVLRHLDMSIEKGQMYPNTIYSPHWAVNSHSIVYVVNGEANIQVAGNNGESVMDERVKEGEMFIIPQFYTVTARAGKNGFEYVSFKTTSSPMKSPLVGYTSVFRAMPIQVLTNAYQVSPSQAQQLKYGREHQTFFLPSRRPQRS